MITRRFIEKVRSYFDELSIEAKDGISFDDFLSSTINTLNHAKELQDASAILNIYRYCYKKWNKIEKMFSKHLSIWQEYNFEDASSIETINDDEAEGVYYITNTLSKSDKELIVSSKSFEEELYSFDYSRGKFVFSGSDDYYIKYAKTDPAVMKLFDSDNHLLCNIVLSDHFEIFLDKNNSEYELIIEDEDEENPFIAVFEKTYIDSLGDKDYIEYKNMVADIEWDLLNSKTDIGVSKVTLYKDVEDITPILFFAASTFLLYKSFNDVRKTRAAIPAMGTFLPIR